MNEEKEIRITRGVHKLSDAERLALEIRTELDALGDKIIRYNKLKGDDEIHHRFRLEYYEVMNTKAALEKFALHFKVNDVIEGIRPGRGIKTAI